MSTLATVAGWQTPFSIPPFEAYPDNQFRDSFDSALTSARKRIDAIATNPDAPCFANTVEALELASWELDRICSVFFNLVAADSNEIREKLQADLAPRLASFSNEVAMNQGLFQRIDKLWQSRSELSLDEEQKRVLELHYRDFVRSGASLDPESRNRFASIRVRLAELRTAFAQNLLKSERDWTLDLSGDEVSNLPGFLVSALEEAARERGLRGYCLTLNRSLIVPFLQYSESRKLRQVAVEAWCNRGAPGTRTDNSVLLEEILALRQELAELLGYRCYADYKLETEMAKSPLQVRKLLDAVWKPALGQARKDASVLQAMMQDDGVDDQLMPWDWRLYAERRRSREFDIDQSEAKQYFPLPRMIEAAMDCAGRLFGLEFEEILPQLYHPDCRAWRVSRQGDDIGIFIGDYFARPSKRSGAWCSTFLDQKKHGGTSRPVVVNVCNFVKPSQGQPCLLSFDDTRTLFHEFGHALHALLSDVRYEKVSGTAVARDFVELPSQLFEHWMELPEVLSKHARHAETGDAIPEDMLAALLAARNFDQGFGTVEYLASAYVDLTFHTSDKISAPLSIERQVLDDIGMPRAIVMRHSASNFAHVFATEGYASGYYSYLWSEVLDADVFETFLEEGGPFNANTTQRLEQHILSAGGSRRPDDMYIDFRGRLPSADALLRKRGFA